MKDNQNEFYSSISKLYPEIFPFNPAQLQFVIRNSRDLAGKHILDIGCATGELAYQLAVNGAHVTGIDLNENLLREAKTRKTHLSLLFQRGDMLHLKKDFPAQQFDLVLCFGNTLVHLPAAQLISQMLEGVSTILKSRGKFLLQILNYDYILSDQITELPLIETENIRFVRRYAFEENSSLVRFQTELYIKKENRMITNETHLLALNSKDLIGQLNDAGFTDIQLFSNFNAGTYGGKHLPLIVTCIKK
jgi:2-polyprenyl-3-methyl-5-hydroxy-6-metoxy-1,4-benzoquinol methylase